MSKINKKSLHLKTGLELLGWTCPYSHLQAWSMTKRDKLDGYVAILKHNHVYKIHNHNISTPREIINKNSLKDITEYVKNN